MFSKKDKKCRYLNKPCIGDDCESFHRFDTDNPELKNGACSDVWQLHMQKDALAYQFQHGAALESLRNEIVVNHTEQAKLLSALVELVKSPAPVIIASDRASGSIEGK